MAIQFEDLRTTLDPPFRAFKMELAESYYGTAVDGRYDRKTGWLSGVSKPWHGFDVKTTASASKQQFDNLYAQFTYVYVILLHEANLAGGSKYDSKLYDSYRKETVVSETDIGGGVIERVTRFTTERKVEDARAKLRDLQTNDPTMWKVFRDWATAQGHALDIDADT